MQDPCTVLPSGNRTGSVELAQTINQFAPGVGVCHPQCNDIVYLIIYLTVLLYRAEKVSQK